MSSEKKTLFQAQSAKREAGSPFSLEEKGFRDEVCSLNAKR